jgi:hypothetical protein
MTYLDLEIAKLVEKCGPFNMRQLIEIRKLIMKNETGRTSDSHVAQEKIRDRVVERLTE